MRLNRFRLYSHVVRSESWINQCTDIEEQIFKSIGRPRKMWQETINEGLKIWNINPNIYDRPVWKKELRCAMKSPTCVNRGMMAQKDK